MTDELIKILQYRRRDKRANLFSELGAMQHQIPLEKWAKTRKDLALDAIGTYIRNSFEGDDPRITFDHAFLDSSTPSNRGIDVMFYVYNSYRDRLPQTPKWVKEVASVVADILKELGWEDVPPPKWYLLGGIGCALDTEDFNL